MGINSHFTTGAVDVGADHQTAVAVEAAVAVETVAAEKLILDQTVASQVPRVRTEKASQLNHAKLTQNSAFQTDC
jgi:hypothetical protein